MTKFTITRGDWEFILWKGDPKLFPVWAIGDNLDDLESLALAQQTCQ